MIDPQAKPKSYLKLMVLVAFLGIVSAVVTFLIIALVNRGIDLIWKQAALSLGLDIRLFTFLACTLGVVLVGLLVKFFGDHNAIFAELLQEFGRTGRFNYRNAPGIVITSLVSLISGAALGPEAALAGPCSGIGTWAADRFKLDDQETRTMGFGGLSGMLAGARVAALRAPLFAGLFTLAMVQVQTAPVVAVAVLFSALLVTLMVLRESRQKDRQAVIPRRES